MYAEAVRVLAKGNLPISLVTPLKLKEITDAVKTTMRKMNPDCDIVINILHLYCDMNLVTFCIERDKNLIIQFSVFIHSYSHADSSH